MNSEPKYIPRPEDIAWAQNTVRLVKDGGMIAYPATQMIYRISHKDKTITLQNVDQLAVFPSFVIHYQTVDVFKEIGYAVLPPKDE